MTDVERLRRRALVWSAPVVLIVVVVALRLLTLAPINHSAQELLDAGSPADAADRFGWLGPLNPAEDWIQPYNTGVARYAGEDFVAAEAEFRVALDRAPGEATACRIRHNLLVSIEAQGDAAIIDERFDEGRDLWLDALDLATDDDCGDRTGEIGRRFADDEDRLRAKLDAGGSGGGDDGPEPPPEPDDETDGRLDELDQQTSDALEQQRQHDAGNRLDGQERTFGDRW